MTGSSRRLPTRRAPIFSRLAFRIALPTVAGAFIGVWFVITQITTPWIAAVASALIAGLAAYIAVHRSVAGRLELAHMTLRQARKGDYDLLAYVQANERGDELDDVLWQVYRAGRRLQQEIERLETLERYRRDFVGNLSHELKTPIFVISGFAEQLLDGALEDPEVNRRFIEKIGHNAERLNQLARDLLAISRIESGELTLNQTSFPLSDLLKDVFEVLEPVAEHRGITLAKHIPPGCPVIIGDRELLRQMLSNLVDNALKYTNRGGHVEVQAAVNDGRVQVKVVDNGIGIPPDALPRITERFYRVDRSRSRKQGGTGLGLAIVKHVLDIHGERLEVESSLGKGTVFSFYLPAGTGPQE